MEISKKRLNLISLVVLAVLALIGESFSNVAGDTIQGDGEIYVSRLKRLLVLQEEHHSKNIVGDEIKALLEPNGVEVEVVATSNSSSVLNNAVLADFDALLWSYAWEPQDRYNAAMKQAVEDWYAQGNRGVGCLHSCQRSHDWPFYKEVFGSLYAYEWNIPSNSQTMILDDSFKDNMLYNESEDKNWDNPGGQEEYYLYDLNPRDLPNTQIHYRIEENDIQSISMGGDHPVVWTREVMGGRSYMNVLNHASHLINELKRQEYVDNLTKSLYWLPGYDTVKIEVDTTDTTTNIDLDKNQLGNQSEIFHIASDNKTLHIGDVNNQIKIFDARGTVVYESRGLNNYDLSSLKGIHYIQINLNNKSYRNKVILL